VFISDFAIKRPIVTVVTMLALVAFGLTALFKLQTDEFPDIQAPIVFVGVGYPGAAPDIVEREVVDRIEDRLSGISGVDKINSTTTDGFAQIIIQFLFEKPVDQATQDVRDAISAVRAQLPAEILEPVIQRFDPNDLPIVSLAVTSTSLTVPQLTQLSDNQIGGELRAVPGVAQVNVVGGDSATLNVTLKPGALASARVGVDQVVNALRAQNLAAPVGQVTTSLAEQTIRLEGRLENPQDFLGLVVTQRGGQAITLGQVAQIEAGHAEPRSAARYNGRPAIGIDITKSKGYSTAFVANGVKDRLKALEPTMPPGTKIEIVRDAGVRVEASVRNIKETLFEGAILTVVVVFIFLISWRSTIITGLALPVSVLAAFIPLWLFGFTLNTMSLLGLSLAIGILIDDAIVVRENIVRHIELGEDHYVASQKGTDEIGLAVAATSFSIVAVFVPVGFMSGFAGQWFKPFALTIAAAVLVSLFVSFSLDPMLSAYWADPQLEAHERRNVVARTLERFNRWFDAQAERYKHGIAWGLEHRLVMVAIAVATFVLAIFLQATFGGFGFVPVSDQSEINIAIELPPGASLDYTTQQAERVAALTRSHKEVLYTYTTIGSASGAGGVDNGSIYVRLKPKAERNVSQETLAQTLRKAFTAVGGVTAYTYASGFGGNQKQVQLQLTGPDNTILNQLAEQIADRVRHVPGATDVGLSSRGQKPELSVQIQRGVAGQLGVSIAQIAQALRPAFAGVDAGTWIDPSGESRYVRVRLAPEARENAADVARIPLVLPAAGENGPTIIPLGQVATFSPSTGPAQITHLDRHRVITVGANVQGASLGNVFQEITKAIADIRMPPGYRIVQGGEVESQQEVFGNIFIALGIAVLLMYLILVVQFGSFLDPISILVSLPLSLIGVVLALLVTGDSLNIMSLIGVILLMGIVAKNAILLIDFAKWGVERGMGRHEALVEAGRIRLRPILMTTLALIAGMIPVALGRGEGADFRAPLGRAVIGGVITSTLLTLFVIPTVYDILAGWREGLARRLGFKPRVHHVEPAPAPGD
jgi:HAE1 family hydrophobic/amphiphilic exporter-1